MLPKNFLKHLFLLFLAIICHASPAQQQEDYKSMFVEAESYFLFEEYNEAVGLYQKLNAAMPGSANINYKLGRCYLNDPLRKQLAISFLEKASEKTTPNFKAKSFKEVNAPIEAIFYLGDAYRVNNQLDKAIETYQKFLENLNEDVFDRKLVEDQIEACKTAKKQMANPIYIEVKNLGEEINNNREQSNAVISGDGNHLVFITKLPFYDAIFYTEKENEKWKAPRNLIPEMKVDGETYPTSINYNGTEIYFYRSDQYNGNLYVSKKENGLWSAPVKLNGAINTKFWESHASISKDGQTLYFTSNRPGGFGDLDIYKAKRVSDFEWVQPENLGSKINSRYNDDTPFITPDEKNLYFSSLGHKTMGGYDIFISEFKEGWSEPKNIGYPINTTSDELFFQPHNNGTEGFMSMIKKEGFGLYDIYHVIIYSEKNPRKIKLSGKVKDVDLSEIDTDKLQIEVFKKSNNEKISEAKINSDGTFELMAESGENIIKINGENIKDYEQDLLIPINHNEDVFNVEPSLESTKKDDKEKPKESENQPILEIDTEIVELTKDGPVEIKFRSERGVDVDINATNGNGVYFEESFTTKRKKNTVKFKPQPGKSKVTLTITNEDGNSIKKELTVIYNPETKIQKTDDDTGKPQKADKAVDDNLTIVLKDLISLAGGDLQNSLKNIIEEKEATNLNDVINKLDKETERKSFSKQDIDSLLEKYASLLIDSYQIKQTKNQSSGELSASFDQILKTNPDIKSVDGLIGKYLGLSAKFDAENLISVLINLAKVSVSGFEELNKAITPILNKETQGEALTYNSKSFNSENLKVYFEEILTNENAGKLYTKLLQKMLLEQYIQNAQDKSTGNLALAFEKLAEEQITFTHNKNFIDYLFVQSEKMDFGKGEIISLLFDLNKSVVEISSIETQNNIENKGLNETKSSKSIFWFAGGGSILLLWLILLFLRRKKKKESN